MAFQIRDTHFSWFIFTMRTWSFCGRQNIWQLRFNFCLRGIGFLTD
ncbi:hypothetical Protein YC6258_03764 [Gynuella sunshinyii YC6258]|uniref:Uncharacterized protein n=1 Tax=Gynuella sunshinyii YC6258 TaxID=1445510 RepID=A0A0C5V8X2_9GAMM|nr:hypothetical Protein YC6258_03764 [Gynuella sunshinyii YC6258]